MRNSRVHHLDFPALVIRYIAYPLWTVKNGSSRLRYLKRLEESQYWSRDRILEEQWLSFRKMFAHAVDTCSYYRDKYRTAGIGLEDLRTPEDITKVPPISKEEIQEHCDDIISSRYAKRDLIPDMTGGSTGSPMRFCYDNDRLDSRVAATFRHNRWAGWNIGDRAAILWGAPQDINVPGRLKDRIRTWIQDRGIILDASSVNEAAMAHFAQKLIRYQPRILQAYSNTLGLFARYVQSENIQGIHPQGIVCSAEVLTQENRRLIETTFNCPVFNRYGCREFAVVASECGAHMGMHINAENLMVETLMGGHPCIGQDGEIVITDLKNFAMPMIRYRIRDIGRIIESQCDCSRGLPLMELSGGRVTDFLLAANGSKVSGIVMATYVITNIPGIRQIQFIQNKPGAVTVNLVKGPEWSDGSMEELIARIHKYLGKEIKIQQEFLNNIPLEKSGKYRFSISRIS